MPPIRRRNPGRGDDVDDEILESLLPKDEDVPSISDGSNQAKKEEENVNAIVAFMLESWRCLLACLALLIGHPLAATLTPKQAARLHDLKSRVGIPYNEEDPEHVESLKILWSAAFPLDAWAGIKNPRWKDMGWQGEDPGTDFRGGGFLSLTNLLYMAQNRRPLFEKLMKKTEGNRADWEYPFAAAGINVTVYLLDSLKLRGQQTWNTQHSKGFLKLLDVSESAFEELYCCTFELLDKIWLEMNASYMQFPEVIRETVKRIEAALERNPADFYELQKYL